MVYLPLWKIWLRQLGLRTSHYDGKVIKFNGSKPPTSISIIKNRQNHSLLLTGKFRGSLLGGDAAAQEPSSPGDFHSVQSLQTQFWRRKKHEKNHENCWETWYFNQSE